MRKTSTMNDFKEIEYGMECLNATWSGVAGAQLQQLLDQVFPGLSKRLVDVFNSWLPHFRSETYLVCLSEHLDVEDNIGRLSMWRAYGGDNGVALVLRNTAFTSAGGDLGASTSPVAYMSVREFEDEFAKLYNSLNGQRNYLAELGEERLLATCFQALRMAVLCTKHPGFSEELEWRVIHSPTQQPSEQLRESIEVVRGVPQKVFRIPLEVMPNGLDLSPDALIDRVIIGPTSHPLAMAQAFVTLLGEAGVSEPHTKVWLSDIPLRQA